MFVTVLTTLTARLEPVQLTAVGVSKVQELVQFTVLFVLHEITGGSTSCTVTTWEQELVFPQASVACHVRVMVCGHAPLVEVDRTTTVTFVFVHVVLTAGGSKVHELVQATALLVAQVRVSANERLLVVSDNPLSPFKAIDHGGDGGVPPGFPVELVKTVD